MGKKIFIVFLCIIGLAGLVFSVQLLLVPKPIPKIKISALKNAEELGRAVHERLRLEVQAAPIIFLGLVPGDLEQLRIWSEFLNALKTTDSAYGAVFIDETLFKDWPEGLKLLSEKDIHFTGGYNFLENVNDFAKTWQQLKSGGQRVAVIVPSYFSSHLVKDNPIDRLEQITGEKVLGFSALPLLRSRDEEDKLPTPCLLEDGRGVGALGCAILQESRQSYRGIKKPQSDYGLMKQFGLNDYLIFYSKAP